MDRRIHMGVRLSNNPPVSGALCLVRSEELARRPDLPALDVAHPSAACSTAFRSANAPTTRHSNSPSGAFSVKRKNSTSKCMCSPKSHLRRPCLQSQVSTHPQPSASTEQSRYPIAKDVTRRRTWAEEFFCFHRTPKADCKHPVLSKQKWQAESKGYKFRTKFAESGALETNGLRETEQALWRHGQSGALRKKPAVIGRFQPRPEPERLFA